MTAWMNMFIYFVVRYFILNLLHLYRTQIFTVLLKGPLPGRFYIFQWRPSSCNPQSVSQSLGWVDRRRLQMPLAHFSRIGRFEKATSDHQSPTSRPQALAKIINHSPRNFHKSLHIWVYRIFENWWRRIFMLIPNHPASRRVKCNPEEL